MPGEGCTSPLSSLNGKNPKFPKMGLGPQDPCGISRGLWRKAESSGSLKREETSSRKTPECGWGGEASWELADMWKMLILFLCVSWDLSHSHNLLYPLWYELLFLSGAVRSALQGLGFCFCCVALPGYLHSSVATHTSSMHFAIS